MSAIDISIRMTDTGIGILLANSLLAPVAALLNRGIEREAAAAELCAELAGRCLVVRITDLPGGDRAIRLAASAARVEVSSVEARVDDADATIIGSPFELNRLMLIDHQAPIREGRIVLEGDTDIAEKFRELLLLARPDWEDELSARVGDSAAFRISSLARDFRDWALDSADELAEHIGEYLQDDARHVPTPEQTNEFYADVDDLANDAERLEARVRRLVDSREHTE